MEKRKNTAFRKADSVLASPSPQNLLFHRRHGSSRKNKLLGEAMGLLEKLQRCPQGSGPTLTSQQNRCPPAPAGAQ